MYSITTIVIGMCIVFLPFGNNRVLRVIVLAALMEG